MSSTKISLSRLFISLVFLIFSVQDLIAQRIEAVSSIDGAIGKHGYSDSNRKTAYYNTRYGDVESKIIRDEPPQRQQYQFVESINPGPSYRQSSRRQSYSSQENGGSSSYGQNSGSGTYMSMRYLPSQRDNQDRNGDSEAEVEAVAVAVARLKLKAQLEQQRQKEEEAKLNDELRQNILRSLVQNEKVGGQDKDEVVSKTIQRDSDVQSGQTEKGDRVNAAIVSRKDEAGSISDQSERNRGLLSKVGVLNKVPLAGDLMGSLPIVGGGDGLNLDMVPSVGNVVKYNNVPVVGNVLNGGIVNKVPVGGDTLDGVSGHLLKEIGSLSGGGSKNKNMRTTVRDQDNNETQQKGFKLDLLSNKTGRRSLGGLLGRLGKGSRSMGGDTEPSYAAINEENREAAAFVISVSTSKPAQVTNDPSAGAGS